MNSHSGVVKWFNRLKGYGFIQDDDGGQDAFVYYASFEGDNPKSLVEGERVSYEVVDHGRGPQAHNLRTRRLV